MIYSKLMVTGKQIGTSGQVQFTAAGARNWEVPDGVTTVSMVSIAGGAPGGTRTCTGGNCGNGLGGGGGGLAYITIEVQPGDILNVMVGAGGANVITSVSYQGNKLLEVKSGNQGGGNLGANGGLGGTAMYNSAFGVGAAFLGGRGGGAVGYGRAGYGGSAGGYFADGIPAGYYGDGAPAQTFGTSLIGPSDTTFRLGRGSNGSVVGTVGGVRIIWGEGRQYPNTNTGNV